MLGYRMKYIERFGWAVGVIALLFVIGSFAVIALFERFSKK